MWNITTDGKFKKDDGSILAGDENWDNESHRYWALKIPTKRRSKRLNTPGTTHLLKTYRTRKTDSTNLQKSNYY